MTRAADWASIGLELCVEVQLECGLPNVAGKMAQVEALTPEDRVLVVGESAMPQTCIKSDEVALMGFVKQLFMLPLPDHSGRRVCTFASRINNDQLMCTSTSDAAA